MPNAYKADLEIPMLVPNIDYGLCVGCGGCAEAYPQFFEIRDERAWIINIDRFVVEEQRGVVSVCPFYAITLEEG